MIHDVPLLGFKNLELIYDSDEETSIRTTPSNNVAVTGLDGNNDYEYYIEGDVTLASATGYFVVAPNGVSSNITCAISGHTSANNAKNYGYTTQTAFHIGNTEDGNLVGVSFAGRLYAATDKSRMTNFNSSLRYSTSNHCGVSHITGYWYNTTTNITTLTFKSAVNFTGWFKIYRVIRE